MNTLGRHRRQSWWANLVQHSARHRRRRLDRLRPYRHGIRGGAIAMVATTVSTVAIGPADITTAAPQPVMSKAVAKDILINRDLAIISRSTPRDVLSAQARKYPYVPPPTPKPKPKVVAKKTPKVIKPKKKVVKTFVRPKRKVVAKPKVTIRSIFDFSRCSDSSGIESGITYNSKMYYRAVCNAFPAAGPFGGYRHDSDSYHGQGRAIDVMVGSRSVGDAVAEWTLRNRKALRVMEIIWRQRIWTTTRPYWHYMEDRGSITANHYDHVHVSLL